MRPGCGSRVLLSTSWWKELELVRDGDLFTVALSCAQNFLNVPLKPTQLAVLAADSANHHQLVPEGNIWVSQVPGGEASTIWEGSAS